MTAIARRWWSLRTMRGRLASIGLITVVLAVLSTMADVSELTSSPWVDSATTFASKGLGYPVPLWAAVLGAALLGAVAVAATGRAALRRARDRDRLVSEGEFLSALRMAIAQAESEVLIAFLSKSWVFTLAFTVIQARLRGLTIRVLVDASEAHDRYHFLALLGCQVCEVGQGPVKASFAGAIIDPENPLRGRVVSLSIRPRTGAFAHVLHCPVDHYLVAVAAQATRVHLKNCGGSAPYSPTIERVTAKSVADRLRGARFYRTAQITFEEIELARTVPRTPSVLVVKVHQARALIEFFEQENWPLFEPAAVVLANGRPSLLVPPVVEELDGRLLVAEGHSRLFALREKGKRTLWAMVVRGVTEPSQGQPRSWRRVRLSDAREPVETPHLARHIETATHLDVWPPGAGEGGRRRLEEAG